MIRKQYNECLDKELTGCGSIPDNRHEQSDREEVKMEMQTQSVGNNNMVRNLGLNNQIKMKMLDTSGFTVRKISGGGNAGTTAKASVPAIDKGANPVKINLLA